MPIFDIFLFINIFHFHDIRARKWIFYTKIIKNNYERNDNFLRVKRFNNKANIIGANIKKYRLKNEYTQEQLCQKIDLYGLNLYHSDIYLIEHNKRMVRDYEALIFAKVFNITMDELYNGTDKELE